MRLPEGGIGFFDSGLGGLTVLDACAKRLQGIPIYYYGDNSRAPYGNLPPEKIRDYAAEAFDVFASLKARAAVIACNTGDGGLRGCVQKEIFLSHRRRGTRRNACGEKGRGSICARHPRHRRKRTL